ncbi:hypothetical protein JCM11491_000814 [Sporobolomyces phaffii]
MAPPSNPRKRPIETIVLDSSDEEDASSRPPPHRPRASPTARSSEDSEFDEALQQALKASLEEPSAVSQHAQLPRPSATLSTAKASEANTELGSMSRAEMERERLARLASKGIDGTSSTSTSSAMGGVRASRVNRPRIATLSDVVATETTASASDVATFANSSSSTSFPAANHPTTQRFWIGSIRRVSNTFHPDPAASTSLSFAHLIGPRATLRCAVVSAFVLDPTWVVSLFPDHLPILLIMPRAEGDTVREPLAKITLQGLEAKTELHRVIPKMTEMGYGFQGCMHTKLLVYFHEDFCRIVIPSANAIEYDWSIIDNAFYVQDFPLLPSHQLPTDESTPFQNPTLTQFSKNFIQVVSRLGAPKGVLKFFKDYDFSKSDEVRLVHSMQGKYTDPEKFDSGGGLASLAKGVAGLGFAKGGKWCFEGTGSSIGKYSPTWLIQFLSSCSGIHPTSYFTPSVSRPASKTSPLFPISLPRRGQPFDYANLPLKIAFPTHDEMAHSHVGLENGGGTIFCPRARWNEKNFPRQLFFRGESKRSGIVAHTKMLLASHVVEASPSAPAVYEGYVYVGSHNLTPSAWGSLQEGQQGKQLAINNYELGVILPIRATSKEDFEKQASELVTYKRPLVRYSAIDRPWMQDEYPQYYGKDRTG